MSPIITILVIRAKFFVKMGWSRRKITDRIIHSQFTFGTRERNRESVFVVNRNLGNLFPNILFIVRSLGVIMSPQIKIHSIVFRLNSFAITVCRVLVQLEIPGPFIFTVCPFPSHRGNNRAIETVQPYDSQLHIIV